MREYISSSAPRSPLLVTNLFYIFLLQLHQCLTQHGLQKCGKRMYDDYGELQPGAAKRLEQELQQYFRDNTSTTGDTNAVDGTHSSKFTDAAASWLKSLRRIPSKFQSSRLPQHQSFSYRPASQLGVCPSLPNTPPGDHKFVLLCVPFMRTALKLYQPEVCRMNSDQEFFRVLRYYYASQRRTKSWFRLRTVKAINFVKVKKS